LITFNVNGRSTRLKSIKDIRTKVDPSWLETIPGGPASARPASSALIFLFIKPPVFMGAAKETLRTVSNANCYRLPLRQMTIETLSDINLLGRLLLSDQKICIAFWPGVRQ
jgi:hypothetical protein